MRNEHIPGRASRNRSGVRRVLLAAALLAAGPSDAANTKPRNHRQPQIDERRSFWTASDGSSFPFEQWQPDRNPRLDAIVVAVHGLSGAPSDFIPLGEHLAKRRISTYAYALRGQGLDPDIGRRGDMRDFRSLQSDLDEFVSLVCARHPDLPVVVYGESMGALVAGSTVAAGGAATVAGVILASPVVEVNGKLSWWQSILFRSFNLVAPEYRIDPARFQKNGGPPPKLTRDERYQAALLESPHALRRFTIRFFRNLLELVNRTGQSAPRLARPTLVLYAGNDIFVSPHAVEAYFSRLGTPHKEIAFFPASYHLLLHDYDRDAVLARVDDWLGGLLRGPSQ